jgi:parvulin-like peptidyl-prolyl isomerase
MKRSRLPFVALLAAVALVASACGGDSTAVPEGAVAVVDGTEVAKSELDELVGIARKAYEGREQEFPKAGTPEFQQIQTQYLAFLVQREQLQQEAEKLGIEVTEEDVDEALEELVKSRFDGDRKEFDKALEQQGFTLETFRRTLAGSVLSQKIFDEVTKDVEVTDEEILLYYTQNQSRYQTTESRDVRHILVAEKGENDQVDYPKSRAEADRIYAELRDGGNFAALARRYSDDPGSKESGGRLTISRGQTVPEFDKTAFELKRGELSRPVRTEYGFHIIEALSEVRSATTTKLDDVRDGIRQQLLQEKRNEEMTTWIQSMQKRFEGKVSYATGFEPPVIPDETETE